MSRLRLNEPLEVEEEDPLLGKSEDGSIFVYAVVRKSKTTGQVWTDMATISHTASGCADSADSLDMFASRQWKEDNQPIGIRLLKVTPAGGMRKIPYSPTRARNKYVRRRKFDGIKDGGEGL